MKQIILITGLLVSSAVLAGGNHFHPKKVAKCESACTEEQVKAAVPTAVKELVNWRQTDSVWQNAKVDAIAKKEFKKGSKTLNTWVVTLLNEKETDATKNKRYVFITNDGYVFKINETGDLK